MFVCVEALRRGKSKRDEEMHKETLSLENTHTQIYIRERKTAKHVFLMIHHQLLMVFLHFFPFSFFLSVRFHQLALPAAGLLPSDYTTPQRPGPSLSSSSVYPRLPACLLSSWGDRSLPLPSCHLRPQISSSFFSPKSRPEPHPTPPQKDLKLE